MTRSRWSSAVNAGPRGSNTTRATSRQPAFATPSAVSARFAAAQRSNRSLINRRKDRAQAAHHPPKRLRRSPRRPNTPSPRLIPMQPIPAPPTPLRPIRIRIACKKLPPRQPPRHPPPRHPPPQTPRLGNHPPATQPPRHRLRTLPREKPPPKRCARALPTTAIRRVFQYARRRGINAWRAADDAARLVSTYANPNFACACAVATDRTERAILAWNAYFQHEIAKKRCMNPSVCVVELIAR